MAAAVADRCRAHAGGMRGRKKRLQKANAFVIYMLGEFVEPCEAKQVKIPTYCKFFSFFGGSCCCIFSVWTLGGIPCTFPTRVRSASEDLEAKFVVRLVFLSVRTSIVYLSSCLVGLWSKRS
jgi:hypothetical protein